MNLRFFSKKFPFKTYFNTPVCEFTSFSYAFNSLDHHFDAINHLKATSQMMSENEKLHLFFSSLL